MYKNGVVQPATPDTIGDTLISAPATSFHIGSCYGTQDFLAGKIDEVRIWDDVRTDTEIMDNMCVELTGSELNLVGYWKLNDTLNDATSNGNNLTNNGGVFTTDVPCDSTQCSITSEFSPSSANVCINDTVFFTNTTVGVTSSVWLYDNSIVDTSANFNYVFSSQGQHTVSLIASNGSCSDTTIVTIAIDTHVTVQILNLDSVYCENDPPVSLTATPAGGTFSGPGVSGNTFIPKDADIGENTIVFALSGSCADSTFQKVTVLPDSLCVTSSSNHFLNRATSIYPNPTTGEFFVLLPSIDHDIIITNLVGQELKRIQRASNITRLQLDKKGIYLIQIITEKETKTWKLLVD